MDGNQGRRIVLVVTLAAGMTGCGGPATDVDPPTPRDVLAAAGKRLSRSLSAADLTALAARGDRVLAALTAAERDALGRGHLRFQVDRPVVVDVAAPALSVPFWLADQGFERTKIVLKTPGREWLVFRKSFPPGRVGVGVNSLDRRASAHYAVFVRPATGNQVQISGFDRERWHTAEARDGAGAAFDQDMPFQVLPSELQGATLLQPAHDQRHATCLATGRVWKTHVVSRAEPDQIAVAFGSDPTRELVWTWRTDPTVHKTVLRLAPAADRCAVRDVEGESRVVESPNLLNDPAVRRHRASAYGLTPNTVYAYTLGDGSPGGWSAWKTIKTAPERPDRYSLLYLGDAQCGLESWGKLLQAARRHRPDVGAILLAGDLVDRGNERTNWDHFFLRAEGVFDALPLMPAVGNHEYLDQGPRLYSAFFELPKNGPRGIPPNLVYSFEYGDACIAVLDSTAAVFDLDSAKKQAEWLDEVLGRTRATWKIVMFHHPVYVSHPTRENPALRVDWVPVFDKHHVDLVLQGHDHAYMRTYPMRANRRVQSASEGTVYLVAVSGDKYCDQAPRDYAAVGLTNVSTYQTIDVEVPARRLTLRAWDVERREVDRLVIDKRPRPSARLARGGLKDVAPAR